MTQIFQSLVLKPFLGLLFLVSPMTFSQTNFTVIERLDKFMKESCNTEYTEIASDSIAQTLKHKVYHISQETRNIYGDKHTESHKFIVIDNGESVNSFERINGDMDLPELESYIKEDFRLTEQTAPHFQGMLDLIYPIPSWKPDKREFFFKNGHWYFLRDAYFRTKQGFEVTVDENGKIISICYKMKWNEPESK